MILIRNKKTYSGPGVYIGRPSVLGNPFNVSMGRKECIVAYDKYMRETYENNATYKKAIDDLVSLHKARMAVGTNVILICWCYPLPCHGDVIATFIKELSV